MPGHTSPYSQLEELPDDPILKIPLLYAADARPNKVNLGIGTYRDATGHPFVFDAVRQAEILITEQQLDKEYLPISGDPQMCQHAAQLALSTAHLPLSGHLISMQTIGGSGALRLIGEFLKEHLTNTVALSNPTWPNHYGIFTRTGMQTVSYPYIDSAKGTFAFEAMCNTLETLSPRTAIVLQSCCHNPTGCDPTPAQWRIIHSICRQRNLIPVFDNAYQGLGRNLADDSYPLQLFFLDGGECFASVSYAKNFGLYGERVGLLLATFDSTIITRRVASHLRKAIRNNYSSPPLHGARLLRTILENAHLKTSWEAELCILRQRVDTMRKALATALQEYGNAFPIQAMLEGSGFFTLSGLTVKQVAWLQQEHALYLVENGRINLAALNDTNLAQVTSAINAAQQFAE